LNKWNQAIEKPLEELLKDREALAIRNKKLAEAYHQVPFRHHVRKLLLEILATTYIPPSRRAAKTDRILLIRPDHLGDLLLTTPAIQALRQHYPNTEIHALVGPWAAGVLANYDEVDLVLTIPFPGFTRGKDGDWQSPYRFGIQTARRLRRIGYAKAIIFRHDHWWGAWLARLTGIPERVGYDNENTELFLTQTVEHRHEHVVVQSLRLVEALTGTKMDLQTAKLQFPIREMDRAYIKGYLSEWGIGDDDRIFCIHPGSGTKVKLWEPEKWAQVADILTEQLNAQVVFTGSDSEMPLISSISNQMEQPATTIAGDSDIGQLAALYHRSLVVLGPDSGPLHLAAATGAPSVALYGPADPSEFGPWGNPKKHAMLASDIACRPCRVLDWSSDDIRYHPCVRDITVTQVLTAARLAASYRDENTDPS
jgi:heptosyltransferase-2/heptosyltransferase-3